MSRVMVLKFYFRGIKTDSTNAQREGDGGYESELFLDVQNK